MVIARVKRDPDFRKEVLRVALAQLLDNPALRDFLKELAEDAEDK